MFTSLLALAGSYLGSMVVGGGAMAALELSLPMLTKAKRVYQAVQMARAISQKFHGRDLTDNEVQRISVDQTLTR